MTNLLVLDKEEYRVRENEFVRIMNSCVQGDNDIFYTSYEDDTIRKVRNYKYIGAFLQHVLYWIKSYKYAYRILKRKYDSIYCINPIVGMFLGLLNGDGKSRIVLAGFLFEPKKNKLYYWLRKVITRKSLKGIDVALVYGHKEVEYYEKIFDFSGKFCFVKYGIDFFNDVKYTKRNLPERFLFSGGGSNRDYSTLINAYRILHSDMPLLIATQPWRVAGMDVANMYVLDDVVVESFGDVMSNAEILVLALKDTEISAGHMVMFQAMSLGIPIVVNDIPAIRDYVDDECVWLYNSGDSESLARLIEKLKKNDTEKKAEKSKEVYETELTFSEFLKRVMLM